MANSFNPRTPASQEPSATSFWDALHPAEQEAFRSLARERTFAAGARLMCEGETANHVIVILNGWTRIYVRDGGEDRVLAERGPGQLVGERGALQVSVRSATVVALETVRALVMSTEDFAAFVSAHPAVLGVVEGQVYQRLTEDPAQQKAERRQHERRQHDRRGGDRRYDDGGTVYWGYDDAGYDDPGGDQRAPEDRRYGERPQNKRPARSPARSMVPVPPGNRLPAGRPAIRLPVLSGENCTIVLSDVAGFGALTRNDEDRLIIRKALLEITSAALASVWDTCSFEDRGDGLLLVAPPSIPTTRVIEHLLTALPPALRRHNHTYGPAIQIQLRVAVDVGPVVSDKFGVSGEAIIRTARMLEAPALKKAVSSKGANLGVIVSSFVYDNAIRQCAGTVDAAEYSKVHVDVKETSIDAWMQLIDPALPALPSHRELGPVGMCPGIDRRSPGRCRAAGQEGPVGHQGGAGKAGGGGERADATLPATPLTSPAAPRRPPQ
jgi:CRP-like cAMP-binding protein